MSQPPSPSISQVNTTGKVAQSLTAQTQGLNAIKAGSIVKAQVIQVQAPTLSERESIITNQLVLAKNAIGKSVTIGKSATTQLSNNLGTLYQATQGQAPTQIALKTPINTNLLQNKALASINTSQLNTLLNKFDLQPLPSKIQALVKSPSLLIAQIQYGRQLNWVFTQEPLKAQDKVQAQLKPDGTLTLINKTNLTEANSKPVAVNAVTSNTQSQGNTKVFTQNQQALLLSVLKQTLPQQQTVNKTFNSLNTLKAQIVTALNITHPQPINKADNAVAKALTQLLNTPLNMSAQIPTKALTTAINQSGVFLESNLLKNVTINPQATKNPTKLQNNLNLPAPNINSSLNYNIKSQLSQLAQILGLPLTQTNSSAINAPPTSSLQQLLLPFFNTKNPLSPIMINPKEAPTKQVALLLQLANTVQQGIAKIRGDQAQQLLQLDSSSSDSTRLAPALLLELPIRHHDQYFSLLLHFFQKWRHSDDEQQEKQSKQNKEPKNRNKVWEVYLEFELDKIGKIAAQVSSTEANEGIPKIRTTLWAKNTKAREFLSKHINQLEKGINLNGMQSTHIECSLGELPENKKMHVSQSLIDIKT